jgi:hypothetical protein
MFHGLLLTKNSHYGVISRICANIEKHKKKKGLWILLSRRRTNSARQEGGSHSFGECRLESPHQSHNSNWRFRDW